MTNVYDRKLPENWRLVPLNEIGQLVGTNINPQQSKGETFEHYSIPAFDAYKKLVSEKGEVILSNKIEFPSGAVLFSKLNHVFPVHGMCWGEVVRARFGQPNFYQFSQTNQNYSRHIWNMCYKSRNFCFVFARRSQQQRKAARD